MQGVKEKALELLSSGKAQRVLGWKKGEFFYDLTPGTFESVQEVEREFAYGVFAGANLSKYCNACGNGRRFVLSAFYPLFEAGKQILDSIRFEDADIIEE